jgi:hypothetical protein
MLKFLAFFSIYSIEDKKILNYTLKFHKQFYFFISGLEIIGHGNPDNNLESFCISCE